MLQFWGSGEYPVTHFVEITPSSTLTKYGGTYYDPINESNKFVWNNV